MIFTTKKIATPNQIKRKITLNSFDSSKTFSKDELFGNAVNTGLSYNFDTSSGALTFAEGIEEFKFNGQSAKFNGGILPKSIFLYKRYDAINGVSDNRIVAFCNDGKLYQSKLSSNGEFTLVLDKQFTSSPIYLSYNYHDEDVLLISFEFEGLYVLNDNKMTYVEGAPPITSMCIHSERLFCTTAGEGTALWFSDDYNIENWFVSLSEAGYVELPDERGEMLKVVSYLDYVYVFRKYGISRVSAYGVQEKFYVENLFGDIGKIYGNTVTVCGDVIVFLSSTGIYRFNGVNCTKILHGYDEYFNGVLNDNARGIFKDGKLYLKLNLKIEKSLKNVVLIYDFIKNTTRIFQGAIIEDFTLIKDDKYDILCVCQGKICKVNETGKLFNKPLKKRYVFGKSNYQISSPNKKLYKVILTTLEPITFIINADGKKTYYFLPDGENLKVMPNLKGNVFSFEIISQTNCPKIMPLTLFFSYYKEQTW